MRSGEMKFALRTAVVSAVVLMVAIVLGANSAHAATSTWTGEGSDTNFSTGANWDVAPTLDGSDELVFPTAATGSHLPNNDLTDETFVSVTFSGNYSVENYVLSGNSFTLTGGITSNGTASNRISAPIVFTGDQIITVGSGNGLNLQGILSGSGNLTKVGTGYLDLNGVNTFTGSLTVSTGGVYVYDKSGLGTDAGGTIVEDGASLSIYVAEGDKNGTITETFTLNGLNSNDLAQLSIGAICGYDNCTDSDITLSGAITLGADTAITSTGTVRVTGTITGNHNIDVLPGDYITLIINSSANGSLTSNGTYTASPTSTTYDEDLPSTYITLRNYQTGILVNGNYAGISVGMNGILKGSGTAVNSVFISTGGVIAPGASPGCISAGTNLYISGEYQAELAGTTACTGYDQLSASGTVVDVTGGTLTVTLLDNYVPKQGDTFTIIDNKGANPVDGTFTDLAEGATFQVGSVVFRISYIGGDGNDVTVTAVTVPALPKTGFAKLTDVFGLKLPSGLQRSYLQYWALCISQRHHNADKLGLS